MTDDTSSVKPISRRVRFEVFRRDNHTCRYCGGTPPDVKLTVDHVMPRALGGGDEPTNLVTACEACNAGKSSTSPDTQSVAEVTNAQIMWSIAARKVAEARRQEAREANDLLVQFKAAWDVWHYSNDPDQKVPLEARWEQSIQTFATAGLDLEDMKAAIVTAMKSKAERATKWRYFCGVCWNEIKERERLTRQKVQTISPGIDDDPDWTPVGAERRTYYNPACMVCDGFGSRVVDDDIRVECFCASDYPYADNVRR